MCCRGCWCQSQLQVVSLVCLWANCGKITPPGKALFSNGPVTQFWPIKCQGEICQEPSGKVFLFPKEEKGKKKKFVLSLIITGARVMMAGTAAAILSLVWGCYPAWGHTITAGHASLLTVWANILSLLHFGFIYTVAKIFLTKLNVQARKARPCAFYVPLVWLFFPALDSGHDQPVWTEALTPEVGWEMLCHG